MKTFKLLGLSAILASSVIVSPAVQAEGVTFLPVKQDGFVYEPTFSITGGSLDADVGDVDRAGTFGIELSFNCPLLATPSNGIRQQLSITSFDNDGLEMTSFEINPHYVIDLGSNFGVGFGPGVGVVNVDYGSDSDTVFAAQLGASLQYRTGAIYLGLDARQQYTGDVDGLDTDVNNTLLRAKLGYDF